MVQPLLSPDIKAALAEKGSRVADEISAFGASDNRRQYPWRELGRSPYDVLIAEVLLKRTTATAVDRIYLQFLQRYPAPRALYDATLDDIATSLLPLGLHRHRALSLKALAHHLAVHENGSVPCDLNRLLQVPGIGPYSARAILSFACDSPTAVVDSNVERVLGRVFLGTLPPQANIPLFQAISDELIPPTRHRAYNFGILDIAALYCRPARPHCAECCLQWTCSYYATEAVSQTGASPSHVQQERRPGGLPQLVHAARVAQRLSLVRLARKAGVTKMTLVNIEYGRRTPRPETLARLSHALGIELTLSSPPCQS